MKYLGDHDACAMMRSIHVHAGEKLLDYTVASVDEAIGLLFLVADQPGLGVTELARRSSNTKARAFRLLTTLEQRGLVIRRGESATYFLSFAALRLGFSAQNQMNLIELVREPMELLLAAFNETVIVRVRDGLQSLCIARCEPTRALRVNGEIGARHVLHAGASSRLLLAFAPQEVQQQVLHDAKQAFTASTPLDLAQLEASLEEVRQRDYAFSIGERVEDVGAVAVPIRDAVGQVVASLSISAPAVRMTPEHVQRYLKLLHAQAGQISQQLGYKPAKAQA